MEVIRMRMPSPLLFAFMLQGLIAIAVFACDPPKTYSTWGDGGSDRGRNDDR